MNPRFLSIAIAWTSALSAQTSIVTPDPACARFEGHSYNRTFGVSAQGRWHGMQPRPPGLSVGSHRACRDLPASY